MNVIVGAWISSKFFDACLVDGYETIDDLIYELKSNFNDETKVLDLFNYLDSNGNGTRNPFKLSLIPKEDFMLDPNRGFRCRDIEDFKNQIDIPRTETLVWKNGNWWKYSKENRNWRKTA